MMQWECGPAVLFTLCTRIGAMIGGDDKNQIAMVTAYEPLVHKLNTRPEMGLAVVALERAVAAVLRKPAKPSLGDVSVDVTASLDVWIVGQALKALTNSRIPDVILAVQFTAPHLIAAGAACIKDKNAKKLALVVEVLTSLGAEEALPFVTEWFRSMPHVIPTAHFLVQLSPDEGLVLEVLSHLTQGLKDLTGESKAAVSCIGATAVERFSIHVDVLVAALRLVRTRIDDSWTLKLRNLLTLEILGSSTALATEFLLFFEACGELMVVTPLAGRVFQIATLYADKDEGVFSIAVRILQDADIRWTAWRSEASQFLHAIKEHRLGCVACVRVIVNGSAPSFNRELAVDCVQYVRASFAWKKQKGEELPPVFYISAAKVVAFVGDCQAIDVLQTLLCTIAARGYPPEFMPAVVALFGSSSVFIRGTAPLSLEIGLRYLPTIQAKTRSTVSDVINTLAKCLDSYMASPGSSSSKKTRYWLRFLLALEDSTTILEIIREATCDRPLKLRSRGLPFGAYARIFEEAALWPWFHPETCLAAVQFLTGFCDHVLPILARIETQVQRYARRRVFLFLAVTAASRASKT